MSDTGLGLGVLLLLGRFVRHRTPNSPLRTTYLAKIRLITN